MTISQGKEVTIEMINANLPQMAQFISDLRKEKKLTQKELAGQLGVTDKAVSKWERGLSYPDIALLSKLSQILGVTTNELLNGEKAKPSVPKIEAMVEETYHKANTAAKTTRVKNVRWKYAFLVSAVFLLSMLIIIACNSAIDRGLAWSILPLRLTALIWLVAMFGAFVMGKNKMASVLLCGFFIYITTFYYSSLNQATTRDISTYGVFNGFQNAYIPHYTIILILLSLSIVLLAISFWFQNKKNSGDKTFLFITINITIIILSVLTDASIMDYVDINGLGVNPTFTIISILTFLMNGVSLAVLAKHYLLRQGTEAQKTGT